MLIEHNLLIHLITRKLMVSTQFYWVILLRMHRSVMFIYVYTQIRRALNEFSRLSLRAEATDLYF